MPTLTVTATTNYSIPPDNALIERDKHDNVLRLGRQ